MYSSETFPADVRAAVYRQCGALDVEMRSSAAHFQPSPRGRHQSAFFVGMMLLRFAGMMLLQFIAAFCITPESRGVTLEGMHIFSAGRSACGAICESAKRGSSG